MEGTHLILTHPVSPPSPIDDIKNIKDASDERKKQIARDFESILLNKVLNEMKNTIGDWGFEKEGTTEQIHSIFWTYLGQELANNGGVGLWKEFYESLNQLAPKEQTPEDNAAVEPLDSNV